MDAPLAEKYQGLLRVMGVTVVGQPLRSDIAASLAMASSSYAREQLPVLEERFAALPQQHQMTVVAARPHPYFVPTVLKFLDEAGSWRVGEQAGQLLVQHSYYLDITQLQAALTAWAANYECRTAAQMPELAVVFFRNTSYLGPAQPPAFVEFLNRVQSLAEEGDSYYRYPALEEALRASGHLK